MENFKCSSAVPNVKYNCAILFWKELYWVFIYASKYFLIDHHCKAFHRIYWSPRKWPNWLDFLYRVQVADVWKECRFRPLQLIFLTIIWSFTNFEMHWRIWGVLHLGQVKLVNCNQILGQVADQNYIAKFHVTKGLILYRKSVHFLWKFATISKTFGVYE